MELLDRSSVISRDPPLETPPESPSNLTCSEEEEEDCLKDAELDAEPELDPEEEKLQQLTGMGFSREQAQQALRAASGDLERATEMLLTGDVPGPEPDPAPSMVAPSPAPGAGPPVDPESLAQLCGMGFPEDQARQALMDANGNLETATVMLLSAA